MRPTGFPASLVLVAASAAFAAGAAPPRAPAAVPATPPRAAVPASAPAASKPLVDACPAQLPVRQTVTDALPGWTAVDQQGSYPFVRVAFYPGPPAESTLIVPTVEYKGQAGLHDRWDLPPRKGGYWVACAYGNTTATVTRQLADDVDFCQADYDGRFITLVVRHWSCGARRSMAPPTWTKPAVRPAAKPATGRRAD